MTTAARPTWNAAMGGRSIRDNASHPVTQVQVRDLPTQQKLKRRQPGQAAPSDLAMLDSQEFRKRLKQKEMNPSSSQDMEEEEESSSLAGGKQRLNDDWVGELCDDVTREAEAMRAQAEEFSEERRRALAKAAALDADEDDSASDDGSDDSESDSGSSDDDDDESDTEELMRELERIKRERQLEKERQEQQQKEEDDAKREEEIIAGNPLLAPGADFRVQRRWDDDVVFKNQTKGLNEKPEKRFINDMLRSDFHKKFMNKYIK